MRNIKIDKLMIIHVLKREKSMIEADVCIGITEGFEEIRTFEPSISLEDAMEAAQSINLFNEGYALHYMKGTYSQEWNWYVSRMDDSGVLQVFSYGETPAMAICNACLKKMGVTI